MYHPQPVRASIAQALQRPHPEAERSLDTLAQAIRLAEQSLDWETALEGHLAKAKLCIRLGQLDEARRSALQAYTLAQEGGRAEPVHRALQLLSEVHLAKDLKEESLVYLHKGLRHSQQLADTASTSWYLMHIPRVYYEVGSLRNAMEHSLQAKTWFRAINDSLGLASSLHTLGAIHGALGNYPSARSRLERALGIYHIYADTTGIGRVTLSIAELLLLEHRAFEAVGYCYRAIDLLEVGDPREAHRAKSLLAAALTQQGEYARAHAVLERAMAHQQTDPTGMAMSLARQGELFLTQGRASNAARAFQQALQLSNSMGLLGLARQAYRGLAQAQGVKGQYSHAFANLTRYTILSDSLYNLQQVSEATKLDEEFRMLRHRMELERQELELARSSELIAQQRQKQTLLYVVIFLFLGIIVIAYREYRHKRAANELLAQQKSELEKQKQIAEHRTRDFTDSLNYAKRIQQAILRTSNQLQEHFSDSALFIIPRDIVSGDFYWVLKRNRKVLFAMADCTGHGVPGAFMSIIGTYGLNRVVNEYNLTNPGEILNRVNALFEDSLEQSAGAEIFDGMDIALCAYDEATQELTFAGANIPLCIVRREGLPPAASQIVHRSDTHFLYQLNPSKQSIGSYFDKQPFPTHCLRLYPGDTLYLYSDGFADQFGGESGKKYRNNELRRLICSMAEEPADRQRQALLEAFYSWKGVSPQVDDVSFMIIRI